jgi:hypothetical protein
METFYTPCICEIVVYSSGITRLGRGCILSTSVIFIDITCRPGTGQGICIGCGIIATAEIGIICALLIGKRTPVCQLGLILLLLTNALFLDGFLMCGDFLLGFCILRGVVVDVIIVVSLC